jgi:hypothetical protein
MTASEVQSHIKPKHRGATMAFSDFRRRDGGREGADRDRDQDRWGASGRDRNEQRGSGGQGYGSQNSDFERGGGREGSDYGRSERYGAGRNYGESDYGSRDYEGQRRYLGGGRDEWSNDQRGAESEYGGGRSYGGSGQRSFNDRWEESYGRGGGSRGSYGQSYGQTSGQNYGRGSGSGSGQNFGGRNYGEERLGQPDTVGYASLYGQEGQRGSSSRYQRNEFEPVGYAGRMSELEAGGPHRGRGPRGYRRSDDRIREDACECLTHDSWIDASSIDVAVKDCEITLSGTVTSREEKRRAEDLVERLSGVKDVTNNIRVVSEGSSAGQGRQSTSSTQSSGAQSGTQSGTNQPGQIGQTGQSPRH